MSDNEDKPDYLKLKEELTGQDTRITKFKNKTKSGGIHGRPAKIDSLMKEKIVFEMSQHKNMARACRNLDLHVNSVKYQMKQDPDFKKAVEDAIEARNMLLAGLAEDELFRRAMGEHKIKYNSKGEAIINPETGAYETEYVASDALLKMVVQRYNPEYNPTHKVEHTGTIEHETKGLTSSILDRIDKLSRMSEIVKEFTSPTDAEIIDGEVEEDGDN